MPEPSFARTLRYNTTQRPSPPRQTPTTPATSRHPHTTHGRPAQAHKASTRTAENTTSDDSTNALPRTTSEHTVNSLEDDTLSTWCCSA